MQNSSIHSVLVLALSVLKSVLGFESRIPLLDVLALDRRATLLVFI